MTDASTCQNLKDKKSNFIETLKIDGCLNERKKCIEYIVFIFLLLKKIDKKKYSDVFCHFQKIEVKKKRTIVRKALMELVGPVGPLGPVGTCKDL